MADTFALEGLKGIKWRKDFIREFVRDSGFEPYMGASPMDIIHVYNDLKADGNAKIRVPLVKALKSNGVTGNTRLTGNEESLDQYYCEVEWDYHRNAIQVSKKERGLSAVDLMTPRRPLLREWASEMIKYQIIDTFHSIDGTKYADADETAKDTWLANNADRVQFGKLVANNAANDHSAALATIDSTDDKLTPALISLVKRRARVARPRIRPFKVGTQGREYYVMFAHPLCFRDLKEHATMTQANREARPRDVESNPIFQDGDLIYDGVIVREIPEFWSARVSEEDSDLTLNTSMTLEGVGASSIDVGVNVLCGAQAIAYANKQLASPITKKEDDYGFFSGVGIEMAHGMEKMTWDNGEDVKKDVGMMTVYAAATADA